MQRSAGMDNMQFTVEDSSFANALAYLYHEKSKLFLTSPAASLVTHSENLALHLLSLGKRYPGVVTVPFPQRLPVSKKSYEEIVASRRSTRQYSGKSITLAELSYLLKNASGTTGSMRISFQGRKYEYTTRSTASGGAIYAVELYVVALNVKNLKPGLYHYQPIGHFLELIKIGYFRKFMKNCIPQTDLLEKSAICLIFTGIFPTKSYKYGERAYRLLALDAGHLGHSIYLSASALDLGTVGLLGFLDDQLNEFLEIDGADETALYCMMLGQKP